MPSGEIVGHGILDGVDVGDPVVAADVADVEEVEDVEAEPHGSERAGETGAGLSVAGRRHDAVGEADVEALVGRSAEIAFVAGAAWGGDRQAVGENAAEVEFEARKLGEVVGEKQGQAVAPVGGERHAYAVELLGCVHQREAQP